MVFFFLFFSLLHTFTRETVLAVFRSSHGSWRKPQPMQTHLSICPCDSGHLCWVVRWALHGVPSAQSCPAMSCLGSRVCLLCEGWVGAGMWDAVAKGWTVESAGQARTHGSLGTPLGRYIKYCLGQEEGSKGTFCASCGFLFQDQVCIFGLKPPWAAQADPSHGSRLSSPSATTTFQHMLQHPLFLFLWAFLPPYKDSRLESKRRSCYPFGLLSLCTILSMLCILAVLGEQSELRLCRLSLCFSTCLASTLIQNLTKPAFSFVLLCK